MPRGDTRRVNSLWIFALLAALCCGVACLHPFVSGVMGPRELLVDITPGAAGTGDEASLMWTRNADAVRDGYWIDLVPLRALPAPMTLTYRLPSYAVRDVTVSVEEGRPEAVGVGRVREQSWFLGRSLAAVDISPVRQGNVWQLAVPPPRWWTQWPARVVLACVAAVLAFGMFVLMWRVSVVWEDLWTALVADVKAPPRWLLGLLALLVVAAPMWMVMWSPVLMEGDGAGFIWFACHFWQDFKLSHFDGWRLPGYSIIIAPLVGMLNDYASGIGVLQAIFGVMTSVMVWDLLRRRISPLWSLACAALVACDPMLLMWQRHVLSETTATVMVTGLVWLVSRLVLDRSRPPGKVAEQLGIPAMLGVVCAAAIYTRANFQTFLVVVPVALCFAGFLRGRRVLALTPGVLVVVIAAGLLAPAFVRNREVLKRTELIVGAGHNRCVFSWQNGTIEYNQTRSVSFPRYRELRSNVDAHKMWELAYTDFLAEFGSAPVPEGTPWVTTRELRSDEVTQESMARMSDAFARRIGKGFFSILGVWFREPWYYSHTVDNMSRVLRGKFDDRTTTTFDDFYDLNLLPEDVRAAVVRVRRPVEAYRGSANASAFNLLFKMYRVLRPGLVVLFFCACVTHLRKLDPTMLLAAGLVLANAAGIALVQYTGMDRYGTPFYPLMAAVVFAAVFGAPKPRPA